MYTTHLDIHKLWVDAQGEVARQRPGGGGPGHQGGAIRVADDGEGDHDGWVVDVLVVQASLKIGQRRAAGRAEGHDLRVRGAGKGKYKGGKCGSTAGKGCPLLLSLGFTPASKLDSGVLQAVLKGMTSGWVEVEVDVKV